jgi:NAD(P)-dependent dehydrogenase (short-subunit alcohol dehydrogenase family)
VSGKTIVITGASSGIGAVAARRLAEMGANVVPVGRSPERTKQVAREVGTEPVIADFASFEQVRALADELLERCPRIDVLVNNAGGLFTPRTVTEDGHEKTFQVNHLSTFLLTALLRERLVESAGSGPVRVVTTSSLGNRFGNVRLDDLEREKRRWNGFLAYCATKLENILFTRELSRRFAGTGVESVCFHPGNVATGFASGSTFPGVFYSNPLAQRAFLISAEQGAAPLVRLASTPAGEVEDGAYYDRFEKGRVNRQANDKKLAAGLWERSEALTGARA